MGPRPFSRGNLSETSDSSTTAPASMGPRPFSRGNLLGGGLLPPRELGLQWGHGLSAVEIARHRGPTTGARRASMGPRPFSRGNVARLEDLTGAQAASMGPRPFSRGNDPLVNFRGVEGFELQWGHGLSAVEMILSRPTAPRRTWLQWGHGLSAVEI